MTAPGTRSLPDALRGPGATALLALAITRRAPLVSLGLALLARARLVRTADAGASSTGTGDSGDDRAMHLALGIAAARLLVPAASAPLALVGSLVLVTGVVLVLAGGITIIAGMAGLSGLG